MTAYDYLTYEELQDAIENDTTDNPYKIAADFLLGAVTDWPTLNLKEPKDLVAELKNEIKDKLNFDNLDSYLKTLTPNSDAWKMEAVTALLEMFDFDRKNNFNKTIELETIIDKLTTHYRQIK